MSVINGKDCIVIAGLSVTNVRCFKVIRNLELEEFKVSIVKPFKAIKYNAEKVLLRQVITPPYDVITPEMREKFLAKSTFSAVRIDLPVGGDDKYKLAGNLYRQWKEEKVLIKDERPAFYIYEQIYEFDGKQYTRSGFVGMIKLSEFGKGHVFPHEKTLSGPKVDRYELMKASKANFSQIFGLYLDQSNGLSNIFTEIKKTMPSMSALGEDGVKHTVWPINDTEIITKIDNFMKDKAIYIADGHHRYETALKYKQDMRDAEGVSSDEVKPYDYAMMMFVNFMDEGLKVFPTHRVVDVNANFRDEDFLSSVKNIFEIRPLAGTEEARKFMTETSKRTGAWTFIGRNGIYGMKILPEGLEALHPVYRKVDTYLLEDLVLKKFFAFTEEKLLAKDGIHFLQSLDEINKYTVSNPAVAFMLHPESMETIREVSESGLVMPQKSTYFYPKLATGLLINDL